MATYTINFINNSSTAGNFCVCQQNPAISNSSIFPLAWLVKSADAHSKVPISWNNDLYFFWARTGPLTPGLIFDAGEAFLTNLSDNNSVTLTKLDGNYKFINQMTANSIGMLTIITDNTIASNQASIGVGMSGSSIVAFQAHDNQTVVFSPRMENWIMFGDFTQGQVLNPSEINDAVQVVFPNGIFSMSVTLNSDNTWTVKQDLN